jgi:V/A-type H+-transporting ATPase subunit D
VRADQRTHAGRLRLLARIELARRAAELLRSKEEALERERVRLEGHATRAAEVWGERCRSAAGALVRARMLGASDELSLLAATGPPPASVTADWQSSMGITYPGAVGSEPGRDAVLTSTAALGPAVDAYRLALAAAATTAAASEAVRRLDAELASTRRRRRAVEDRLLPSLETDRHELDLHLDELDREEALRVRIAVEHTSGGRP